MKFELPVLSDARGTLIVWAQRLRGKELVEDIPFRTWEPEFAAIGSMTVALEEIYFSEYRPQKSGIVDFYAGARFTTGGTASKVVYFTAPTTIKYANLPFVALISNSYAGIAYSRFTKGNQIGVTSYDNANWPLGAGQIIYVSGSYIGA